MKIVKYFSGNPVLKHTYTLFSTVISETELFLTKFVCHATASLQVTPAMGF